MSNASGRFQAEGRAMQSYIIGFVLSLVLTLIPYFMVVNKIFSGTALLAAILGLAVLQMMVQITFFLHLGRGPKPNWNLFFFISTVGIILVVVGGSIMIINNLHYNMLPSDQAKKLANDEGIYQIGSKKTGACKEVGVNHQVTIKNGQVSPLHTLASKCDSLTFITLDDAVSDMAFGPHVQHQAYAGESDLMIRKGHNETITLSEPGTYQFHDHFREATSGDFTVVLTGPN